MGPIQICEQSAGQVKVILQVKYECRTTAVIVRILTQLNGKASSAGTAQLAQDLAPPLQASPGDPVSAIEPGKTLSLLLLLLRWRALYCLEAENWADIAA